MTSGVHEQANSEQILNRNDVRSACITDGTKKAYQSSLHVIARWIMLTHENSAHFFDQDGDIDLTAFTPSLFENFLISRLNNPGKKVAISTLSGYRSAIKDLYRRKRIPLPAEYGDDMKTFFSGMKRIQTRNVQSGSARNSGKLPLSEHLYKRLCLETMRTEDNGFSHLFLVTQWNLMCRSKSVQTIQTQHFISKGDSIGCFLHQTKTNQEGNGPQDPRHLYANPLSPRTCWVLALGIYFACNPRQRPGKLFPGSNQKNRFCKALTRCIRNVERNAQNFGTHSVRKGVATFACSGSTGGPSIVSVCLRCGWSLGGVQDRYLRYEAAGDQYLGRVVAGLPLNSTSFDVLPPHFTQENDPVVKDCIAQMFPLMQAEENFEQILEFCLASIVFHSDFLTAHLPPNHALLSTSVFRHEEVLLYLKGKIITHNSDRFSATGIPPHIELYRKQQETKDAVDKLPQTLFDGFSRILEEKGAAAGNVSREYLEDAIRRLLAEANLHPTPTAPQIVNEAMPRNIHCWGGGLHYLPRDFDFPSIDPLGAWKLWWFGHQSLGYPPFHTIKTNDLETKEKKNTFYEWKTIMQRICTAVEEVTVSVFGSPATETEALELFKVGYRRLSMDVPKLAVNDEGRSTQLKVTTASRHLREAEQALNPNRRRLPFKHRKRRRKNASQSPQLQTS